MRGGTLLLSLFLIVLIHAQTELKLETKAGQIKVSYGAGNNNTHLFTTGSLAFRVEGVSYGYPSAPSGGQALRLDSVSTGSGSQAPFGEYRAWMWKWYAGKTVVNTSVKSFLASSTLVFEVNFPEGASNVTLTGSNPDSRVSNYWPSVRGDQGLIPRMGRVNFNRLWDSGTTGVGFKGYVGGVPAGGGAPVFLFTRSRTLVMSPLANFKSAVFTLENNELRSGIQGMIADIPRNFTHSTVLVLDSGVNEAVKRWGAALQSQYGKPGWPHNQQGDYTNAHLGYWTDNGAYYYYQPMAGKNYEETMAAVRAHMDELKLPVQYYQLDSWWYYQGKDQGVTDWVARPDIFPSGMEHLTKNTLRTQVALHNRWWSPETPYAAQYPFVKEERYALPKFNHSAPEANQFFDWLLRRSKEQWNCTLYEQDWLSDQYQRMKYTRTDIFAAADWHRAMGRAALKSDMHIQYCMPYMSDMMQSVESMRVSQARVSDDNVPGATEQYKIGTISMVAHALGLAPFKDVFLTTSVQSGLKYFGGHAVEPNPELQMLVSVLTAGPVGFGDKIGSVNVTLVKSSCMSNGLLLKPDAPATTPDSIFYRVVDGKKLLDVRSASTEIAGLNTHFVLTVGNQEQVVLTVEDLNRNSTTRASEYVAYPHGFPDRLTRVNAASPLRIAAVPPTTPWYPKPFGGYNPKKVHHSYWVVVPVMKNGFALLGEADKFVAVSKQRFTGVRVENTSVEVSVVVPQDDTAQILVLAPKAQKPTKTACKHNPKAATVLRCTVEDCLCV